MTPEYLEFRCCMCPNINTPASSACPPFRNNPETPCRFVKSYIDERGWKYKVMSGISGNTFKARYQKPEKKGPDGWHCLKQPLWRDTFDKAQHDLTRLAKEKGWAEWQT